MVRGPRPAARNPGGWVQGPLVSSPGTGYRAGPGGQDGLVQGWITIDQHGQPDLIKQSDDPGMGLADSQGAAGPFEPEVMSQQQGDRLARKVIHELEVDDNPARQRLLEKGSQPGPQGLEVASSSSSGNWGVTTRTSSKTSYLIRSARVQVFQERQLLGGRGLRHGHQQASRPRRPVPAHSETSRSAGSGVLVGLPSCKGHEHRTDLELIAVVQVDLEIADMPAVENVPLVLPRSRR